MAEHIAIKIGLLRLIQDVIQHIIIQTIVYTDMQVVNTAVVMDGIQVKEIDGAQELQIVQAMTILLVTNLLGNINLKLINAKMLMQVQVF